MFAYKKLKNGNYTFEGAYYQHMEDVGEYLNMRFKSVLLYYKDEHI